MQKPAAIVAELRSREQVDPDKVWKTGRMPDLFAFSILLAIVRSGAVILDKLNNVNRNRRHEHRVDHPALPGNEFCHEPDNQN